MGLQKGGDHPWKAWKSHSVATGKRTFMKRIVSTVLFAILAASAFAQGESSFIVLHVKGEIKVKSTGKALKPSDRVGEEERVVFGSPDALAAVMHPTKGRFLMKPVQDQDKEQNELVSFVRSTLVEGTGRASTRAGKLNNDLAFQQLFRANPQKYFGGRFAFIGDTATFEVSAEAYPLTASDFFFLRFQYRGETINKKIPADSNQIRFAAAELFRIDGQPIQAEDASGFQLLFRHSKAATSRLICDFSPVFVNIAELKEEFRLLRPYLEELPTQEKVAEFQAYMADAHGKADADAVRAFIENIENTTR